MYLLIQFIVETTRACSQVVVTLTYYTKPGQMHTVDESPEGAMELGVSPIY